MTNCPFCGTELLETTYGRLHCPNHGIIHIDEEDIDEAKEVSYIG
jgi:uncharacterized Zn finger protein (UPF0148 family)